SAGAAPATGTSGIVTVTVSSAPTPGTVNDSGTHEGSRPMTETRRSTGWTARLRTCTERVATSPEAACAPPSTRTLGGVRFVMAVSCGSRHDLDIDLGVLARVEGEGRRGAQDRC